MTGSVNGNKFFSLFYFFFWDNGHLFQCNQGKKQQTPAAENIFLLLVNTRQNLHAIRMNRTKGENIRIIRFQRFYMSLGNRNDSFLLKCATTESKEREPAASITDEQWPAVVTMKRCDWPGRGEGFGRRPKQILGGAQLARHGGRAT